MFALLILACNPPSPPPPPPPPPPADCFADASWINNPIQPSEVATSESFCDFYQFSWQWFLAQMSPTLSNPSERVFEELELFVPNTQDQCASESPTGRKSGASILSPRVLKPQNLEDIQADHNAVYDQNGNILWYNIWYAKENCQATDKGFVPGTLEIKASWMVLDEEDTSSYLTIPAQIESHEKEVQLGLIGFHMAIWTPNHPEMIWATWEHKSNSPLCDGSSEVRKWNLASEKGSECLAQKKSAKECGFNIPSKFDSVPPLKSSPTEVCREFKYGNQTQDAINGNDNNANYSAIDQLNDQLVGSKGLLSQLEEGNPMSVFSNYYMVGALWTKGGADSGSLPVPHKGGEADPTSLQRGSLELTNSSMETFEQGSNSYVPNCFGCHNYNHETPLGVSHIQQDLQGSKQ